MMLPRNYQNTLPQHHERPGLARIEQHGSALAWKRCSFAWTKDVGGSRTFLLHDG